MMNVKKTAPLLAFAALLALLTPADVQAQEMKKLAQTGFQFLKIDPDARGAAMGGAFVAVANNSNAVFWNPAGLSEIQSLDVGVNHTRWFADIALSAISGAVKLGNANYVGISFLNIDYGDIEATVPSDNEAGYIEGGTFNPGGYAVGLSYARQFSTQFTLGGQVKYAHEDLGASTVQRPGASEQLTVDNALGGLGFDIGTLYYTGFHDLRVSLAIRNFSKELEYENEGFQMPLTFDLGIAMDVLQATNMGSDHRLTVAVDAIHPRDYTQRLHLGAEYTFMDMFSLRTGYKVNYDTEGLTAGLGLNTDMNSLNLRVDYAYSDMGSFLGNVHRISLGGSF